MSGPQDGRLLEMFAENSIAVSPLFHQGSFAFPAPPESSLSSLSSLPRSPGYFPGPGDLLQPVTLTSTFTSSLTASLNPGALTSGLTPGSLTPGSLTPGSLTSGGLTPVTPPRVSEQLLVPHGDKTYELLGAASHAHLAAHAHGHAHALNHAHLSSAVTSSSSPTSSRSLTDAKYFKRRLSVTSSSLQQQQPQAPPPDHAPHKGLGHAPSTLGHAPSGVDAAGVWRPYHPD